MSLRKIRSYTKESSAVRALREAGVEEEDFHRFLSYSEVANAWIIDLDSLELHSPKKPKYHKGRRTKRSVMDAAIRMAMVEAGEPVGTAERVPQRGNATLTPDRPSEAAPDPLEVQVRPAPAAPKSQPAEAPRGRGRPRIYDDDTVLALRPRDGASKLHRNSARRAIVNFLVESGGKATLQEMDDHFGFSIRSKAISLVRAGWLSVDDGSESVDVSRHKVEEHEEHDEHDEE